MMRANTEERQLLLGARRMGILARRPVQLPDGGGGRRPGVHAQREYCGFGHGCRGRGKRPGVHAQGEYCGVGRGWCPVKKKSLLG